MLGEKVISSTNANITRLRVMMVMLVGRIEVRVTKVGRGHLL